MRHNLEAIEKLFDALTDEQVSLLVSEWAEQNRYLPVELTPDPGRWRNDRAPYLTEIMDCLSESSPIRKIAIMKGTQGGFTTGILENALGYTIDCSPCPCMYISADRDLAKIGVEVKIDRMIDSIEGLKEKIRPNILKKHGKTTGDTATRKDFPGGFLLAVGARSPAKLRMISIKRLFRDEIDGFPLEVGKEGDPLVLSEQRTKNFSKSRKILDISTPTIMQTSKIYAAYERGDKREFFIPCPKCGEFQTLHFFPDKKGAGLHFELDENDQLIFESVHYQCKYCRKKILDAEKIIFLNKGEWRAGQVIADKTVRSYFWTPLLSPWYPWLEMVKNWLDCKNKIETMKSFYNTELGLPWEERGEAPSFVSVMTHRRMYQSGMIPNKLVKKDTGGEILFLTAAIDTQDNGLYVEVRGWSYLGNAWSIQWEFFPGDTSKAAIWIKLRKFLFDTVYKDETGRQYQIEAAAIDAGGHRTKEVYAHCTSYPVNKYLTPMMGRRYVSGEGNKAKAWELQKEKPGYPTLDVYSINTTWYKNDIAYKFKQEWKTGDMQPDGYLNFPEDYGEDYFTQYTAESLVIEKDKRTGATKAMYWKASDKPNHAFDVCVYNNFIFDLFAYSFCTTRLGLENLDWSIFWDHAKRGIFYT